jgi:hypothetical protein
MSLRRRGMRKTIEVASPWDPDAKFTIARATNREDVERTNMFSKMRVIQNLGTPNEIITERDIPMGSVQVGTIILCCEKWNLKDDNGRIYEITEDNILDLLSGAERRWLYESILDFNPIWKGEEEEKVDSEEE